MRVTKKLSKDSFLRAPEVLRRLNTSVLGRGRTVYCAHILLPSGTRVQKQTPMVGLLKPRILARLDRELG